MKAETVAALIIGFCLVAVVAIVAHPAVTITQAPAHVVAAVTPAPTPPPAPDPFAPARWAAANVTLISLLLVLGIGVPLGIALHAHHRSKLLELEHPPLRDREAVQALYAVKALEARRGWLPESFTYSPHTRNDVPDQEEEAPLELPGPTMSAEEALELPGICYGQRMDTGEPLTDPRLLSLAIGGRPGSGKSSTVALLAAQYVKRGALVFVADPHSGVPDSLLRRLDPVIGDQLAGDIRAETPAETLMMLERVHDQLEQRKAGWRRRSGAQRPIVAIVDEFSETLRLLSPANRERMLNLVQIIGYGGRKYGVAAILMAQSWLAGGVYSSQVRNPLPASIVHTMRADEARGLTGINAGGWPPGADPLNLPPGEAYTLGIGSSGLLRVRVPQLGSTRARAGASSSSLPGTSTADMPAYEEPPTALPSAGESAGHTETDGRVLDLFRAGADVAAIVREIHHVESNAGVRYQRARQQVEAALRRSML